MRRLIINAEELIVVNESRLKWHLALITGPIVLAVIRAKTAGEAHRERREHAGTLLARHGHRRRNSQLTIFAADARDHSRLGRAVVAGAKAEKTACRTGFGRWHVISDDRSTHIARVVRAILS